MSAFLSSPDTINALATYWFTKASTPGNFTTPWGSLDKAQRCSDHARNACEDPTKRDQAAAEIICSVENAHTACFKILLEANQASLEARYPDDTSTPDPSYKAKRLPIVSYWIQGRQTGHLVGLVRGYSYQACEHSGWETSVAHELIEQIQRWLLKDLETRDCGDDGNWAGGQHRKTRERWPGVKCWPPTADDPPTGPRTCLQGLFPSTYLTPAMQAFLASSVLCLGLSAGFWFALTSTLTDMTKADCYAGVERACDQLNRDGVKL